ncbi:MAG TPA: DEAD/DEAH box helicase [Nitrososphaerales archaeon]|nr:DEAD/DEAH box helicase [Nitrososphaerales archaeon]
MSGTPEARLTENGPRGDQGNVFQRLFSPPLLKALEERGFTSPTDPQMKLVPLVAEGRNALLMAPTGTGKTEAAFLPILDNMIRNGLARTGGIKLLYITPLRALNRDMLERMQWWCKRFDIRLGVRHGDTGAAERAGQSMVPPDILITTPETLQALLTGRRIREGLTKLKWMVVDEIHELAEDKRGSQLSIALERLRRAVGRDFQLVGLSATIGSPETIGKFLVGEGRECEIVRVPVEKMLQLSVVRPQPAAEDVALAESIFTFPEVAARLRTIRDTVDQNRSTLIFTNTRSEAEALANRFRVWNERLPIGIHHSSLSRATREATERSLREGKLSGVICTSSLELGIDIGFLDCVIQYNSPRQVSRLIQRIGRAGHSIGQISKGIIITQDSDDTLEAMVLCRKSLRGELEPLLPFLNASDAAIHQIAGLLIESSSWRLEDLYSLFRRTYPYSTLSIETMKSYLVYMRDRYPRLLFFTENDGIVKRAKDFKPLFEFYFENLSMIPDEKQYIVIAEGDRAIGVLDEAFVSEYGQIGVKFVEAGRCWKILELYGNKVYVAPEDDPTGAVPSWVGDEIPVPLPVALEVGAIRREYAEALGTGGRGEQSVIDSLRERYPVDAGAIALSLSEVKEQVSLGLVVPSDRLVTIEKWDKYVVIQATFGHKVNRLLARVVAHILSERMGQSVAVHQDPYRIILEVESSPRLVEAVIRELAGKDVKELARAAVERSGIFKRRLIHVAKKCGAIAKEADFASVSISGLMEALRGTPVYEEALSVIFHDDFDVAAAESIVSQIQRKEIEIAILEPEGAPSPIARIGLEEVSRRGEIVSPERLRAIIRQSTEARIRESFLVAACTNCWEYVELRRVGDGSPERCPRCGRKDTIGFTTESYETVFGATLKARSRLQMHGKALKALEILKRSAQLKNEFGDDALYVIAGRGIRLSEAPALLKKRRETGVDLIDCVIEGEREALKRRYFVS